MDVAAAAGVAVGVQDDVERRRSGPGSDACAGVKDDVSAGLQGQTALKRVGVDERGVAVPSDVDVRCKDEVVADEKRVDLVHAPGVVQVPCGGLHTDVGRIEQESPAPGVHLTAEVEDLLAGDLGKAAGTARISAPCRELAAEIRAPIGPEHHTSPRARPRTVGANGGSIVDDETLGVANRDVLAAKTAAKEDVSARTRTLRRGRGVYRRGRGHFDFGSFHLDAASRAIAPPRRDRPAVDDAAFAARAQHDTPAPLHHSGGPGHPAVFDREGILIASGGL